MGLPTPPDSAHRVHFRLQDPNLKPSLPIEIPARRKPKSAPVNSPITCPASPDLIFEMSPVALSESPPPPACHPAGWSPSLEHRMPPLHGRLGWRPPSPRQEISSPHEPFMYPFPVFSPRQVDAEPKRSQDPIMTSPILSPTQAKVSSSPDFHLPAAFSQDDQLFSSLNANTGSRTPAESYSQFMPSRGRSRHPARSARPRLSLPFQNSRSNAPKPCQSRDENFSPSEIETSPFEFEKYLIHRIEDERPVRSWHRHGIPSLRVSVRS
jgi:hypothetical protein